MDIDTFIEYLARTRVTWYLEKGVRIRAKRYTLNIDTPTCPVVAVAGGTGLRAFTWGDWLGLSLKDITLIVHAADSNRIRKPEKVQLRQRMLQACGLDGGLA